MKEILQKLVSQIESLVKEAFNLGANRRDFFTNFSENSRANKFALNFFSGLCLAIYWLCYFY